MFVVMDNGILSNYKQKKKREENVGNIREEIKQINRRQKKKENNQNKQKKPERDSKCVLEDSNNCNPHYAN